MKGEEEDNLLLSSLGIKSANPEDIERDVIKQAKNYAGGSIEVRECSEEEELDHKPPSTSRAKISSRLRALEVEIEAVAETVQHTKRTVNIEIVGEGDQVDDKKDSLQSSDSGLALQHALATDRLRSLKRTKAQLQRELDDLVENDPEEDILLDKLVKEEPKLKRKLKEVQSSGKDSKKRQKVVAFDDDLGFDAVLDAASAGFVETERDELVRKGILTPFHKLKGFERRLEQPGPSNQNSSVDEDPNETLAAVSIPKVSQSFSEIAKSRPTTKLLDVEALPKLEAPTRPFIRLKVPLRVPDLEGAEGPDVKKGKLKKKRRPLPGKRWRIIASQEELLNGNEKDLETSDFEEENLEEIDDPCDNQHTYVTLEGGLKIPENIFSHLFDFQKVGVQWLWELHCQRAGGILGDEMGLGKTIQVLSFLASLHFSDMYKPSIVICPVTLLRQWKREAQKWYPSFHVEILHDSVQIPSGRKKKGKSDDSCSETDESWDSDSERPTPVRSTKKWDHLIDRVFKSECGLLITTYEQIRLHGEKLLDVEWGYAVLDEGHRIRNPNAEVTLVCKQLQTVHRIIMTGAPIQNKLSELWSLFDFVFPGKLGVLPVFETEFAVPITVGGYANATPLQVSTAYRCAVVLRDLIMPYLLRRMKADVNAQLPKKTEHVLFCSLTSEQRAAYRAFLASSEVEQIFDGNRNSLYGIDIMRKICNHPDLLEREHSASHPDYGNPERSGKMKVVAQVLKLWKDQGHRVLLFAQTQQMLDILETFLIGAGHVYRRMDGLTPVKHRMALIDEFNDTTDVFIFILTTKVGGLGTNLTGANRVIIFDPDWNPSTDMQARERAWRIGQKRDVTVYRLITRGTIEEKVYHRQIYKHFLTNKILKNPQQRRFFKARDMKDLFTLQDDQDGGATETSNIFSQLYEEVNAGVDDHKQEKFESSTLASTDISPLGDKKGCLDGASTIELQGEVDQSGEVDEVDEETNLLKNLFDAHGLHSAMNHDMIMNANDGEKMRLDEQASQVAQRAAEALRESRKLRSRDGVSIPTWTGRAGAAGAPPAVRRKFGSTVNTHFNSSKPLEESSGNGGPCKPIDFAAGISSGKALSSADLLSRIRETRERAEADGHDCQGGSSSGSHSSARNRGGSRGSKAPVKFVQPEVLIRQLCTFIQLQGGTTKSSFIVQHFKNKVPSKDLGLFKNLLREIAILQKDQNGCSIWVLKAEYKH
ncbi:protein CHROMATIN REMODELING 8 isoform X2 [Aristolochia californica]|uniref:protein CHROMATIN REMODELING 8 isoform X2 n=1 Tax=Aristolochia californica TaxID=171875 RepID=UPI0035DAEBDB